ncbi:putative nucleic acid-binding protein [Mexico trichovirus]|uniref:RNA silencing suppressor n=1 Tax=peach virus M TaxID=3070926 RepID=A0AA48YTL3_9VIRU|nr:putative nucleic acid-binding protein [Mexico trichovirus]QDR50351.1 putative nucleic acid-binding protein [peach virus M]
MMEFNPKRNKDDRKIASFCIAMMRHGIPSGLLSVLNGLARRALRDEVGNKALCGLSSLAKKRRAKRLAVCSFCYRTNCVGDYKCAKSRNGLNSRFEKGEWIRRGKSSSIMLGDTPVCSFSLSKHIESEVGKIPYL